MKAGVAKALVFVYFIVVPTYCQTVQGVTPERIREAIAFGTSAKELSPYRIQEKARWSWPPLIGFYTTPFLRVALATNTAKKRYQTFTEANVTPEMIAPEIQVYAPSQSLGGASIANVVTVILLPYQSKDTSQAVHPARMMEASLEYKNLFGFAAEGKGMIAVFPLDVWIENNEVHVVFDSGIPSSQGPGKRGGCTDCKSRINLEKVR
jgi:hypothetical protein